MDSFCVVTASQPVPDLNKTTLFPALDKELHLRSVEIGFGWELNKVHNSS